MPIIDDMMQFGIDELYLARIMDNDEGDETTPPTYDAVTGLIRLRGTSSFEAPFTMDSYDLEGDNGIVDTLSKASGSEIKVEFGVLRLEHFTHLFGNEVMTAGGDQVLIRRTTDSPNFLGIIGVIHSSQTKIILPVCKAINIEMSYSNLEHVVCSLTLKGIRRRSDNALQIIRQTPDLPVAAITDFTLPVAGA